ncbi:MAG: MOSC domain-containing protein [Planctomycetes bacterium]|nr:MOSC domain-containing protein [Planctomycetota bacterium]
MEPRILSLHVHPVKSCRARSPDHVRVGPRGFEGDREFAFCDEAGRVLTQRQHPRMATVDAHWDGAALTLSCAGHESVTVDGREWCDAPSSASVHGTSIAAHEVRDARASRWMTELLSTPATLVRRAPHATRASDDGESPTTLADAGPISVLARASMDALNARMDDALPIDRFRTNVIVDGVDAFFEDSVEAFDVGGCGFRAMRRIQRCVMVQTDQRTGERGIEPMRTLREVRSVLGRVFFGRYFVVEHEGVVRVGDRVLPS